MSCWVHSNVLTLVLPLVISLARPWRAVSEGVLLGGVRWWLCELGSSPGQQPVGWGVTWALLRCVLFVFRCVCELPALRGSSVWLDHVIMFVRPLCIRVMDGVYLHANFVCCSRLIAGIVNVCIRRIFRLPVWGSLHSASKLGSSGYSPSGSTSSSSCTYYSMGGY